MDEARLPGFVQVNSCCTATQMPVTPYILKKLKEDLGLTTGAHRVSDSYRRVSTAARLRRGRYWFNYQGAVIPRGRG